MIEGAKAVGYYNENFILQGLFPPVHVLYICREP